MAFQGGKRQECQNQTVQATQMLSFNNIQQLSRPVVYSFSTQVRGKLHEGHLLLYCVGLLACCCSLPCFQKKHAPLERVYRGSGTVHFHSRAGSFLRCNHSTLEMATSKRGAMLLVPCKLTSINCTLTSQCREALCYPFSSSSSNCLLKTTLLKRGSNP